MKTLLAGACALCFFCCFSRVELPAQKAFDWSSQLSLLGNTGFTLVPTAYLAQDRQISAGFGYIPKDYSKLAATVPDTKGDKIWFVNLGFLPFMEMSFRVSYPTGVEDTETLGIGDRSVFVRLRLLKEKKGLPAVAVGLRDPFESGHYHCAYAVLSKHLDLAPNLPIIFTAGYGFPIVDSDNTSLDGVFGGVAVCWKMLQTAIEYDAEKVNVGLKADLLNHHLRLGIDLLDFKALTGSIGLQFSL